MSDIEIVTQDEWRNPDATRHARYDVPSSRDVEDAIQVVPAFIEGLHEGAVPAVDWAGVGDGPAPKRRGRPRKVK